MTWTSGFLLEEGSYAALAPAQVVLLHGVEDYGAETLIPVSSSWRPFTASSTYILLIEHPMGLTYLQLV